VASVGRCMWFGAPLVRTWRVAGAGRACGRYCTKFVTETSQRTVRTVGAVGSPRACCTADSVLTTAHAGMATDGEGVGRLPSV
jgi:hypothetical protein